VGQTVVQSLSPSQRLCYRISLSQLDATRNKVHHIVPGMVAQHGFFARRGGKVFTPHSHQLNSPSSTATSTSSANHRRPGVGIGKSIPHKRHHRVPKDSIFGITKGDIRRLARRGGVKRISAGVYDVARHALKDYITDVLPFVNGD